MTESFFFDNEDLQFRLAQLDLREVLELKEKAYSETAKYPAAPRNYADAKDSYKIVLEVLGEICAERVAPRAAEADEEGAHYENGEVTYAAPTLDAIAALRQAELFGAMLPREFGGLNLPESIYQMMVEVVARAESGLMTVFGLQEIASLIEEYGDPETKARVLPRFSRGEASGAMVPDRGRCRFRSGRRCDPGHAGRSHRQMVSRRHEALHHQRPAPRSTWSSWRAPSRAPRMAAASRCSSVCEGLPRAGQVRRIEHKLGIHGVATCELQYNDMSPPELMRPAPLRGLDPLRP
jgi:hypothetical protein